VTWVLIVGGVLVWLTVDEIRQRRRNRRLFDCAERQARKRRGEWFV
jgi:uncharacterized membrane protein